MNTFAPGDGIRTAPYGLVVERDLAEGIAPIHGQEAEMALLVLVRLFSEPIGLLSLSLGPSGLSARELALTVARSLEPELRIRFDACGLRWDGSLPTDGLSPPRTPAVVTSRERILREGPSMTLAVCTRDRPDGLPALLDSLCAQRYERRRILVVDNAPSDDRTRRLVGAYAQRHPEVDYLVEPTPGLSRARNRAIEASDTEVVAWADDDEVCDPWWAFELARGFVEVPEAGAVTGIVIPAELQTRSQAWFEQYSGLYARRGFTRAIFSPATRHRQSPLYPLPPFGIGGNMAWRRRDIDRIGRFDPALGPGTVSMDGDDTAALTMLLLSGGTIVYQPSAIVHHRHRQDYDDLRHLLLGYGRGVGAFYASVLMRRPACAVELLRLSRRALRDEFSARGRRLHQLGDEFPRELLRANRLGLLEGPFVYALARSRLRHRPSHAGTRRRLGALSRR